MASYYTEKKIHEQQGQTGAEETDEGARANEAIELEEAETPNSPNGNDVDAHGVEVITPNEQSAETGLSDVVSINQQVNSDV